MDKELLQFSTFDAADYLKNDADIQAYLDEAMRENDPQVFLQALNTIARARGMSRLAKDTGIPRESLYQSLSSSGNPCFSTLWKIAQALGCTLCLQKKAVS